MGRHYLASLGALKDPDRYVRAGAVHSLGIYSGPKAKDVLPALRNLQQSEADPKVRETLKIALEKLSAA